MQIVSLRFLSYRYKKECSVAFKIRQNPFSAGALPRTPLGELTTLPCRPPSRLKRGHPHNTPTPFGTDPPSALAMRSPQNSSQIYSYVFVALLPQSAHFINNNNNNNTSGLLGRTTYVEGFLLCCCPRLPADQSPRRPSDALSTVRDISGGVVGLAPKN